MTKFIVNIWAYNHHAKFKVESEDSPTALEQSILDKLGENSIVWENLGNSYNDKVNRITYEEVIDDKVKQIITDIKLEEAAIAHRQNTIEGSAPEVSVAT